MKTYFEEHLQTAAYVIYQSSHWDSTKYKGINPVNTRSQFKFYKDVYRYYNLGHATTFDQLKYCNDYNCKINLLYI